MKIFSKHFPYICSGYKQILSTNISLNNQVICNIGANIGCCIQTFENLFMFLQKHRSIAIYATSHIYKNSPFGYVKQPDFYNASMIIYTSLDIRSIFVLFSYLERKFGRLRRRIFRNAPRTLDIDIIFYNNKKIRLNHMHIPHIDYVNRQSVISTLRFHIG
ncbi:2-amino-4-hydroxy-6-hydroxymethyldihydropteridine diphosphokinase [Helicobacter muridarum]|uniref:2-amino-4-hydroxy-6-hydroxymethyldihydropteridine pyrophosphokinase n=1 Tax=Helicobacter muridarum TaxID=216 RepID=A0A099U1I2_9HELI|nr:2-amino-4-hydroxy-6-hydroxymethyldihydropteridine diphosphokinase [Helicobacter muridarum]TLE00889.1 2-amino-4-hydroxy-6-hydroxymethyldihydropteridine diphosphokinase [Helicobacter muridarum]STQ86663.1 7, 8-dihydro-6-hydroxymethylpterin-pyrophosphokinase [Helicobacter muridarum]